MDPVGAQQRFDFHKKPLDRRKSISTTADDDQGDTCRICRGEGTPDQPLFYPCKCSGSIKFVHQACLLEWLSHSQKKYCELCKTSFRFTKLYNPSMPATLPLPLFLRQVGVHACRTLGRWLRYVFVTFIWICLLPWSIRQIWRGLFWLADGSWMTAKDLRQLSSIETANEMVNGTSSDHIGFSSTASGTPSLQSVSFFDPVGELFSLLTGAPLLRGLLRLLTPRPAAIQSSIAGTDLTGSTSDPRSVFMRQPSLLSNVSSLNSFTKYPTINNGFIDVLEGQMICLSVIAAFILVFLIREWVINQQPILNMPNPDHAENEPVPAPPNEEARQPGRRRRLRRIPGRDELPDNRNLDLAQRPIATPRTRRAATDGTDFATDLPGYASNESNALARSSSLTSGPPSTGSSFAFEMDDDVSWGQGNLPETQDLGPPPLQRGIFDEVLDRRRNIEERMVPTAEHSFIDSLTNSSDRGNTNVNQRSTSPYGGDLNSDRNSIQRTDFIFGRTDHNDGNSGTTNNFTFTSSFNTSEADVLTEGDQPIQPERTDLENFDSSWESTDIQEIADDPSLTNENLQEIEPSQILMAVDTVDEEQPGNGNSESDNAENHVPNTIIGHLVQWMWHTEEAIRVQDQAAVQLEHEENHGGHDRGQLLQANNVNPVGVVPVVANAPAREPNVQFGIDINDPNALDDAEDLEGILELIGMEGPLAGMLQNIIFSVFLITLTLSASVWCPYIWGKIAILIMSNPVGVFVKAPLFFISKLGNILIDLLLFIGGLVGFGLSNIAKLIKLVVTPALPAVAAHIKVAVVENWAYAISQNSGTRLEKAFSGTLFGLRPDLPTFSMQSHHALRVFRHAAVKAMSAILTDLSETLGSATILWQRYSIFGVPIFLFKEVVSFPQAAASATHGIIGWWYTLTEDLRMRPLSETSEYDFSLVEWTTEDKILAILVGYFFFAAAGYAYLKIAHAALGLNKDDKVDGVFADSLRQAGGVLKVIIIIGIEMIVFPLYCGLLLDCALLPLFREASFQSRLEFLLNAPVTCLFIHWFVGTCYMFHFALFVSMCRKIVRKGVLYFIRDPDDPTFHPVRDVLERPVATQLGKIAFSALVYGGLVIVCLGGVIWTVSGVSGILPIQWAKSEPRLAFPVDIIFFNFMLPIILRRAEPSKKISTMYEWWFRQCAKTLRLSHFLFGEEYEEEKLESQLLWPSVSGRQSNVSIETSSEQPISIAGVSHGKHQDGRYVRAPAADSVRIPKGTKVFVEVNYNNERVDGEPDRDTGMHGKKDERFVKIYIPPHFRARVSVFVFLVWLFAASTGVAFTVVPLLLGRLLIRLSTASKSAPNDLYAFTMGTHVCIAAALIAYTIWSRKDVLVSRFTEIFANTTDSLPRLYRLAKRILGVTYLFAAIFVVLPFATSLLTELYIHMPIYSYFASSLSNVIPAKSAAASGSALGPFNPTIFILQTWTLGLLYLRLTLRFAMSYPSGQNRPSTALRAIVRNGYLHPDVALASRALVLPAMTLCVVLLTAPLGLARMFIVATGIVNSQEKLQIYRYSYPFLLGMAVSVYAALGIQHKIEGWRVKVRDEVYLVGERLHNFTEMEAGNKKLAVLKGDNGKGKGRARDLQPDETVLNVDRASNTQVVGHEFGASENAMASGSLRT